MSDSDLRQGLALVVFGITLLILLGVAWRLFGAKAGKRNRLRIHMRVKASSEVTSEQTNKADLSPTDEKAPEHE